MGSPTLLDISLKLQFSPGFLLTPCDLNAMTQVDEHKMANLQQKRVDLNALLPSLIKFASKDLVLRGRPSYVANLEEYLCPWNNLASPPKALAKLGAPKGARKLHKHAPPTKRCVMDTSPPLEHLKEVIAQNETPTSSEMTSARQQKATHKSITQDQWRKAAGTAQCNWKASRIDEKSTAGQILPWRDMLKKNSSTCSQRYSCSFMTLNRRRSICA